MQLILAHVSGENKMKNNIFKVLAVFNEIRVDFGVGLLVNDYFIGECRQLKTINRHFTHKSH